MERQRHVCVIDCFGVNYDGTMPTILLACDENSVCSLSGRAAKSPGPRVCRLRRTGQIVSIDKISQRTKIRKDAFMIKFFFVLATAALTLMSIATMDRYSRENGRCYRVTKSAGSQRYVMCRLRMATFLAK